MAALGAALAACSTAAWFAQADGTNVNGTSTPAVRTVGQADGKRMSIDLAPMQLTIPW
jgi:hypothetical protein